MEWWAWVSAVLAALVLVSNGIKAIKELTSPMADKLDAIKDAEKRLDDVEAVVEKNTATQQAMMTALVAIINHEMDGNGIEGLKNAREKLLSHIIEK